MDNNKKVTEEKPKAKRIGIVGYMNDAKTHFGAPTTYLSFISNFGKPVIILPDDDILDIDLLIMPGGLDLNPSAYGQVPSFNTTNTDVFKQAFFDNKLKGYIEKGTPIFGICLGSQMLAAYFGSKLTQHLKWHSQSRDRWETAHNIFLSPQAKEIMGRQKADKMEVNSHHHQAVLYQDLGEELEALAFAANEDCPKQESKVIIEAFRHKTLPIYAVQYHPEELYDNLSISIIKKLLTNDSSKEE